MISSFEGLREAHERLIALEKVIWGFRQTFKGQAWQVAASGYIIEVENINADIRQYLALSPVPGLHANVITADDWARCSRCGVGTDPDDQRAQCQSRRGLFGSVQCTKPAGHGGPIHFGYSSRGMALGWSTSEPEPEPESGDLMARKNKSQQRYTCPKCRKSWLTDAYAYGVHALVCTGGKK